MLRHTSQRQAVTVEVPELEVIPVTRLEVVLDTGLMRSWDLESDETYTEDAEWLVISKKTVTTRIRAPRIVCIETSKQEHKRLKKAVTPEQIIEAAREK